MKITLTQLYTAHACSDQVLLFKHFFGGEVEVTRELALQYASRFDFEWAAKTLLSSLARKMYREATASVWKAYDEASKPAWKAYIKTTAPAWTTYRKATAPARKEYEEAIAIAFVDAYNFIGRK